MDELIEILDWVARLTPLALALAGLIAFLSRERIKHYFASDLEDRKSKLLRDLEAYKVSLIADAERVKAAQEVKKAAALRVVDRHLDCISALAADHVGFGTSVAVFALMDDYGEDAFLKERQKLIDQSYAHERVLNATALFLDPAIYADFGQFRSAMLAVLAAREGSKAPLAESDVRLGVLYDRDRVTSQHLVAIYRDLAQSSAR